MSTIWDDLAQWICSPPYDTRWRVRRSNAPAAPWVHRHSRSPIPASGAPSAVRATAEAVGGGTLVRLNRSPAADEQIQTLSGSWPLVTGSEVKETRPHPLSWRK